MPPTSILDQACAWTSTSRKKCLLGANLQSNRAASVYRYQHVTIVDRQLSAFATYSRDCYIEASLLEENRMIHEGKLKEDNPLDLSEPFRKLCEACRRGDLRVCQEMITEGANINARDPFDYTPLILVITYTRH